jgi:hypothetical protein
MGSCVTRRKKGSDVLVTRHLVWALVDPRAAFAEWFSLLNPGGRLLIIESGFVTETGAARLRTALEKITCQHLTLKQDATRPASFNLLQQQERFDDFVRVYNNERPHQALAGACPGEVYTPSARLYRPSEEPDYPFHDRTVRVTRCGRICIGKRKINLSTVFAGQIDGLREVDDQIWLVSFLNYDLGYFDDETCRLETLQNPFGPKVLPMSSE